MCEPQYCIHPFQTEKIQSKTRFLVPLNSHSPFLFAFQPKTYISGTIISESKKSAARIMHIILTIRFDLFALFLIVILLVHIVKNYKRHGSKADRRRRKQNPQNFLNAAPV